MKKISTIALFLFVLSAFESSAQVKVEYDFPAAMSESTRNSFILQCDKGKILYEINCAKCHNFKVRKKEFIPDFTPGELVGYELRVLNPKHENDMPEERVSAEELGLIMTFLTYKKKNKVNIKKKEK